MVDELMVNNKKVNGVYTHHLELMISGDYTVDSFISDYNALSQMNMDETQSLYFQGLGRLVFEFFYRTEDGDTRPKDTDSLTHFLEFFIIFDMCQKGSGEKDTVLPSFLME